MYEAVLIAEQAYKANNFPFTRLGEAWSGEAREKYWARQRQIDAQFAADLARELANDLPKSVQDAIFQKAWDYGHPSGYGEVANHYDELVRFARAVRTEPQED